MRLVVSAAVLALWTAETPSGVVDAFSIQIKPQFNSRPRYSGLSSPSLHMSTMERSMTAPNSPNSAGHPFGAYGKPPQDGNKDENAYSFGPKTPRGNNDASADSFEAYMRARNSNGNPPSNPSSPSDNYIPRQRSSPDSNFGAPSTPPLNGNTNNNFGAPSSPTTPVGNNNSFSSYASRGNASTPPPPVNNFGAPSTPQTPPTGTNNFGAPSTPQAHSTANNFGAPSTPQTPPAVTNKFGAPSTPQTPPAATNSFGAPSTPQTPPAATNNFGAPSTPQPTSTANNFGVPSTPPATSTAGNTNNSFSSFATGVNNNAAPTRTSNANNFGAPASQQTSATPSSSGSNSNSFESFATGGNSSKPQSQQAPPAPGSFEAYMNSRQPQPTTTSNNSASSPFPSSTSSSQSVIASTVAAAADPNSPLPPYMSPASLEDANIKSANIPGSPMPSVATQQSTSTATVQTTFREQDNSMRNQLAPPIKAPLARVGTPVGQLDIGSPSQELVGRLDQVLNKQREFEVRLDHVDQKIDRTTQENIERTQSMLNDFREENMKTQETYMNRIKDEVGGMKSTMDRVLNEQRELKQKQENQTATFANLEKARSEQAEKLLALEKTTSIRANNLERNTNQESQNQAQRLEALERNAAAGGQQGDSNNFLLEQQQNERMAAFEQNQVERMAAFEESQRQELENALREHREASQQHQEMNNKPNGVGSNSYNFSNNSEYRRERERMDETEQLLQERLESAQKRKEELLQQLREMQQQEEMYSSNGTRSSAPPPPPPYANPLDQGQKFQQQQSPPGSPSQYNAGPPSRFDQEQDDFDQSRQSRFKDDDKEEEETPRRNMLRDRLGKASGEQLYQQSGVGRRGSRPADNFDTEGMDPEEKRRTQHEQMMRRDPVSPPVAMGPGSQEGRNRQPPGSPAGRYDPRRGGPSNDMLEDELAYGISEDSGMQKTLNNMRSFKGDEQMPNSSLFDESGTMGGAVGMDRRGSSQQTRRRVPASQTDRGMREKQYPPQQRSGSKQRRAGLSESPPPNPLVEKKIEHFLKEILSSGPKPHFDKEMESLLMIKYSPLFSWLKPANVSFLRNVLITYLQHKGCQVEMDLKSASPKAAHEWSELLNILSFELKQRTGEEPRIMEEPDNQWGIYGSKNVRLKVSADSVNQQRQRSRGGGVTREEAARRKRRNDKAFIVSTDPTDPTTRLL